MDEEDSFGEEPEYESDGGFGSDSFNDEPDLGDSDDDAGHRYEAKDFQVLGEEGMERAMNDLVTDVSETLNTSQTKSSMLLRSNGWNKEKLVSAFFDNSAKVEEAAGVHYLDSQLSQPVPEGEVTCDICDDDMDAAETKALGCGHPFCKDCWGDYLTDRISKGKQGAFSKCPGYECTAAVDDDTVRELVDEQAFKKYHTGIVRSFIEDSKNYRWCPAPRCERAIKGSGHTQAVKCDCGFKFCFRCAEEDHAPATCDNLMKWLDKCRDESETAHWIIANTKKCPKCNVRIEKNQGCNHIVCHACKHDFCWVCMGIWADHGNHTGGFYKCNKFDPKKSKKTGNAKDDAKAELDRYLHYYQRFHNHDQSKRFAEKLRQQTEDRMTKLQESSSEGSWMDVQFLKDAMEQVLECRRVLKYTYVFGYYIGEGPEKELFEYLQQELEKTTEKLSELSEMPIDKITRADVVNHTRVTNTFMKNLLGGVARGLTQS